MGIKVNIRIKEINGNIFNIEIPYDMNILNVKLLIGKLKKLDYKCIKLIYKSNVLNDIDTITSLNINDNDVLLLIMNNNNKINNNYAQNMSDNNNAYIPLETKTNEMIINEIIVNEKINLTVKLAKWIRLWSLFVILVTITYVPSMWFIGIPFLFNIIGWFGAKSLNRCCLCFPLIVSFSLGVFCMFWSVYFMFTLFQVYYYMFLRIYYILYIIMI